MFLFVWRFLFAHVQGRHGIQGLVWQPPYVTLSQPGGRLCPTYTGVLGWLKIAVAALCWLDFRLPLGFEMKNVSMYFDMYVVIIFNLWSLDKA